MMKKRLLSLLLAALMILSLAACGEKTPAANGENTAPGNQQTAAPADSGSEAPAGEPDEGSQNTLPATDEPTGYHFRGYTETADWPGADMWKSYGLPELALDEDVSGTVHISDKDWIYPLNGSDGILLEVRVMTRHLEELMEILNNSDVVLEETDEYINEGYSFCYQNNGTKMKIQLAEWEIDVNDYKLSITIITDPTD